MGAASPSVSPVHPGLPNCAIVFIGVQSAVSLDWGIGGIPSIYLIGPDGTILAADLRGQRIKDAVAEVLRR